MSEAPGNRYSAGRGRGSYGERQELRRPMTALQDTGTAGISQGIEDIKISDNRGIGVGNQENLADKVKNSQLSAEAAVFVPRWLQGQGNSSGNSKSDDHMAVLHESLSEIHMSPGKFDSVIPPLVVSMNTWNMDIGTLTAVVNVIFDKSVSEANFRYSGAKLCKYLTMNLNVQLPDKRDFQSVLLDRCREEYEHHTSKLQENGQWICGYAFFLAELLLNMKSEGSEVQEKIPVLADSLTKVLLSLTSTWNEEYIKCICQVLKLSGSALEDLEHRDPSTGNSAPEMDCLMNMLKNKIEDPTSELSSTTKSMISNVITLRAADWGRKHSSTEFTQNNSIQDDFTYNTGLGGSFLSAEEQEFLAAQGLAEEDDAWDDEMERDYEIFLRSQENGRC